MCPLVYVHEYPFCAFNIAYFLVTRNPLSHVKKYLKSATSSHFVYPLSHVLWISKSASYFSPSSPLPFPCHLDFFSLHIRNHSKKKRWNSVQLLVYICLSLKLDILSSPTKRSWSMIVKSNQTIVWVDEGLYTS